MKNTIQNSLMLIGLVLLLALGYYLYSQSQATTLNTAGGANDVSVNASMFLRQINELKQIDLNTSLLNDQRFSALVDYSAPITPLPIGKDNPFEQ